MKKIAMVAVIWLSVANPPWGFGFDINQIPAFGDGKWKCEKTRIEYEGTPLVAWGKSKSCHLKSDPTIHGTMVYPFDRAVPFYKRWQKGNEEPYHALNVEDGWINFGIANVQADVDADTQQAIAVRVRFKVWNDQQTGEFAMFNPKYPWLEEAKNQLATPQGEFRIEIQVETNVHQKE